MDRSDSQYRTLFEFANDAHFVLRDDRFVDANRQTESIFERPVAELIGLSPWEVSPVVQADGRTSKEKAQAVIRKAFAGEPQVFEWTHIKRDGTPVLVEVSLTRIDLDDGPAVYAVLRDLTERTEARETIRRSQEQLSVLADLLPAMVARLDTDLRFTFANQHWQEFLARREAEILGHPLEDLVSPAHFQQLTTALDQAKKGVAAEAEILSPTPDGSSRVLSATYVPEFSEDGEVSGIVALTRDVTASREAQARIVESESRARVLFNSTPLAVMNLDLQGKVLSCNVAFTEMHATRGGPLDQVGRDTTEFIHEKDRDKLAQNIQNALSGKGPTGPQSITLQRDDGSPFPAEVVATAIRDPDGKPISIVAHGADITERLEAEAAERKAKEDLRALSQRLEDVREEERASISRELHDELGQALTSLRIDLGALREKARTLAPDIDGDLSALEIHTERTLAAVRGLSARLRPPVLDVLGLGPALQWQAEEVARRTSIEFLVRVPEESIPLPMSHSAAMFRIAQEALTNIVRHASASRVDLIMEVSESELTLTIRDDGVGVDTGTLSESGSLGLVGMRERAASLGGSLVVEPGTDGGTRVCLTVPLGKPAP